MSYEELIQHYGSQAAAARALGLKPPSVSEWKDKGVPIPRQAQYELLTKGRLRAERHGEKRRQAA